MARNGKRVLIVEDHEESRTIYKLALTRRGYGVLEADNAEDGVRLARSEQPDLVLMDVLVPPRDGWQAVESLKRGRKTASIPVVVVTAYANPQDRQKALELGAADFLEKPVQLPRLVEEVERIIGPAGA